MIQLVAISLAVLGCCGALISTLCLISLVGTELAKRPPSAGFRWLEDQPGRGTEI